MAYAAVTSLLQILRQLMLSDQISIPYPKSPVESIYSKVCSLQALLEENFPAQSSGRSVVNDLETQIRDAIYEAEDIIESHISSHFFPSEEYGNSGDEIFTQGLQKLLQELDSVWKRSAIISADLRRQSAFMPVVSSGSAPAVKGKLVGLEDGLLQLKEKLIGESSRLEVVAVVGMAGIGKTTLVNEVYEDPSLRQIFHYRAWATLGPDGYVQFTESIYKNLKGRRYLIVFDGLFDVKAWDDVKNLFPNDDNGSRILLTTRLRKVALHATGTTRNIHHISFLGKDESWDLLHDIVFAGQSCPHELLKIGKTIAQNCQGLPLTIVLVGGILSGAAKTPEYWRKVADNPISAIFDSNDVSLTCANDENLPQHLKACFLYMGVFPLNYEIPVSKLIKLWVAEGFLKQRDSESSEEVAEECLEELVDRSLILVHKWNSSGGIKTCSVHSAVWHLCVNAAEKDNFFCDIKIYTDGASPESTSLGRRLCIRKNILFSIKDVYNTMVSVSKARSLLCLGPDHSHPLRVCLDFRFLRVLDVLTILFKKFPIEILKLIQLRYLALTCNRGDLPASLSKLRNLQVLIVRRNLSIKFSGAPSYLPVEIWNMKYLRHLQFMGCDLPDPCGALLPNLLTLSNVSGYSCTKQVLKGTPNLKKLGICIELAEDVAAAAAPLCLFDHLELLTQLESFKCIIRHPNHELHVVSRPDSISNFPSTLKKLTLSGCGFPWEDMKIIAQLPELEVLKLRCYAFQGPEWELDEEGFIQLKFLLLEDMDIQHWTANGQILQRLERLVIRHCYNLREIPHGVDYVITLRMLEVVDCSPSVVDSAMRIQEMQEDLSNDDLQVCIDCSWNDHRTTKH